ncbi:CBS domain-containing protein [Deinococcus pimensis]|uniref:CBS domain-containing protein n=1 Tax=Deinococcus pimensis TaxID=309888 RepID=UPI0005EB331E|nr:CBS domain-containing protein [Deinococcus pimensis]
MTSTTRVADVMTRNLVTVDPSTTVPEAVQLMKNGGFRRLPVRREGRLVGIVTDRDLKEAMPSQATSLSIWEITYLLAKLHVGEVMSRSVITTTDTALLSDAAYTMLKHRVGGLPVVNGSGELVGIVTVTDVLRDYVGLPVLG